MIVVERSAAELFALWTERAAEWWPFIGASHPGADAIDLTFERHVGGRVFETVRDGREVVWGHVLVWEPPRRFVYSYSPFADARLTEVEVRFEPLDARRTELHVEHRGWEAHGEEGAQRSAAYAKGWVKNLQVLSDVAERAEQRRSEESTH